MFDQVKLAKKASGSSYTQIPGDKHLSLSVLEDESQIFTHHNRSTSKHRVILHWGLTALSGFINIVLLIILCRILQSSDKGNFQSYATGFKTEFAAAREYIELVETKFNGAPSFRKNGSVYVPRPDPILYVGNPRKYPEVDQNWENLLEGRYFRITEAEAFKAFGGGYKEYWSYQAGGYVTGLDLFHTLHCVNHLRRAFYPEVYRDEDSRYKDPETVELHRNHCLEHIRQYIMCHGDLTPIPTKYYEQADKQYVDSDVSHTCRNFEKIKSWMLDRYAGQTMVHSIFWNETTTTSNHFH